VKVDDRKKRSIAKLKHPLPSYQISFEKHFEIIKAYIVASKEGEKPVSWKDFQNLVSFSSEYVSANNKFFEDLGLIKESEKQRGKYNPTPEAIEFSKMRDWDQEQAKNILRKLILKTWFWESTKQLLIIRQKITKDDLVKNLDLTPEPIQININNHFT